MEKKKIINISEAVVTLWILFIFLSSLPYKFTKSEETQFIFGTIGDWLGSIISPGFGTLFSNYAGYIIGTFELTSSILLITAIYFLIRKLYEKSSLFFGLGGGLAMALMSGAAFFHIFSPLGIDVNGDGGSLFRAAVSIVFIGGGLFVYNFPTLKKKFLK